MQIKSKKSVKIDEIAHLIRTKEGATFSQLWHVFYYTRLFKYIHKKQFVKLNKTYNKVSTHKNLQDLCALGYLKNPAKDIYCAKDKVLPILKEAGFITETLPAEPQGNGDINELNNTEVFISLMKEMEEKNFHTFLFPHFGYLIPDALMVQLDNEKRRYKLTFIEVERKKPSWEQYIEQKKKNYLKLSTDIKSYEYWKEAASLLKLPVCTVDQFKFSVCIIGKVKAKLGDGFRVIF